MLAMMFGGSVPEAAAQCLYVGLMTDSGGFRFPRTTPEVFRLAAQLVESGADPVIAYEKVFNTNSVHRTRLLGHALAGMILHDGKLCTMTVTQADLAMYGCTIEDTEGFVHHTLSLEGVQMGVLFVELPGQIKCSFRSKGNVYVHALAASYNGGGHVHAAGARVPGRPLSEVMTEVVARALAAMTSE
jgi:phosphoesterase RecJ-like protein